MAEEKPAEDQEQPEPDAASSPAEAAPETAADGEEEEGLGDVEVPPRLAIGIIVGLIVAIGLGFFIYDRVTQSELDELVAAFEGYRAESDDAFAPSPRLPIGEPRDADAREVYLQAVEALTTERIASLSDFLGAARAGTADSADFAAARAEISEVYELMREAARCTRMSPWVDFSQGATAIDINPYNKLTFAYDVLSSLAFFLWQEKRHAEALELVSFNIRSVHDLVRGGPLAAYGDYWRPLLERVFQSIVLLSSARMGAAERDALVAALESAERDLPELGRMVAGERWVMEFQCASESGAELAGLPSRAVDVFERSELAARWRLLRDYLREAVEQLEKPYEEAHAGLLDLEARFATSTDVLPKISSYLVEHERVRTKLRLLIVGQRVYRHRDETDALPASLGDIGVGEPALRDRLGGGSFIYVHRPEGLSVLYSVGSDGKDDGGNFGAGGPTSFADVSGQDLVLPFIRLE